MLDGWRPLTFTWRMTDDEIVATLDEVFDRATGRVATVCAQGSDYSTKVNERGAGDERRSVRPSEPQVSEACCGHFDIGCGTPVVIARRGAMAFLVTGVLS